MTDHRGFCGGMLTDRGARMVIMYLRGGFSGELRQKCARRRHFGHQLGVGKFCLTDQSA